MRQYCFEGLWFYQPPFRWLNVSLKKKIKQPNSLSLFIGVPKSFCVLAACVCEHVSRLKRRDFFIIIKSDTPNPRFHLLRFFVESRKRLHPLLNVVAVIIEEYDIPFKIWPVSIYFLKDAVIKRFNRVPA